MARRPRRPLGPLDLRSQAILRAVIEEYVATAQPVGSQALVERYGLGVSSATVRHVLADLEMAGLLTHPHTSAGRVPTDAGYRYFVESLAETMPLPSVEQLMIRHQFGQVEFASEQWFQTLPAEVQQLLLEEGRKAGDEMTRLTLAKQDEYLGQFREAGVTIVEDIDIAAFQEATAPTYGAFPKWSPGLHDTIEQILAQ